MPEPKSISSSVTGSIAPLVILTWSAPSALNIIVLSVAKSISLSASLPITKDAFVIEVIPVCDASTVNVKSYGSPSVPLSVSVQFVVRPEPINLTSLSADIVTSVPSSSSNTKLLPESLAHDIVPEPSVLRTWLAEPSDVGYVTDVVPKPIASK